MSANYHPVFFIILVGVLAPLLAELPVFCRVPIVVLEIVGGVLIGPQVLGLAKPDVVVEVLSRTGMGMLFLIAGMEIDFSRLRGRPLTLAAYCWVASLGVGLAAAYLLRAAGLPVPVLLVALALTTTAIGTLLPILRDSGELARPFGVLILAAGAVGEFGPLLVLSLMPLEGHSTLGQAAMMLAFVGVAVATAVAVVRMRTPRLVGMLRRHFNRTSQLPVRGALLLMAVLAIVSERMGFEILIGAFAAGMILGMVTRGEKGEPFRQRLDGVGFGYFIPVFFVATGIRFDLNGLLASRESLMCVPLFLALFLAARGLPVFLFYRRELGGRDQLALAFYSASALPVVVAITHVGVVAGQMTPETAAALVGAGMISLLVFPQVAAALRPASRFQGQESGRDIRPPGSEN